MIASLRTHAEALETGKKLNDWLPEEGQELLKEKAKEREDKRSGSLSPLDFD